MSDSIFYICAGFQSNASVVNTHLLPPAKTEKLFPQRCEWPT